MILPKHGRVIIIDDQIDQALPLISVLSKYNISHTYFNARVENLPNDTINDVRIVFLDINLNGTQQSNWATEKGMLIGNITRIIKEHVPYILFIWSINEEDHFQDVVDLFDNELIDYKPIISPIKMEKYNVFKQVEIEIDGKKTLKSELNYTSEETLALIQEKINNGLTNIDSFEAIIKWENVVADSTTEIINEIVSLASGRESLNSELKNIYFKLAEAHWGRQMNGNAAEITNKAVSVFNHLLMDKLDFNIQTVVFDIIKEIKSPEKFDDGDKAIFNSKLLLNFHDKLGAFPGNAYLHNDESINNYPFNGLIADSLLVPLVVSDFFEINHDRKAESINEIREYKNASKKAYAEYEKTIREQIKEKSKFITIEISPICDFAQKKWRANRICPAVLWHCDFVHYINKSENLYVSPILLINDVCYYIVMDLRYFTSAHFDTFKDAKPIFSLKHSFLTDIQSVLSRHINRPGITSLN